MTKFGVTTTSFLVLAVSAYSLQYPSYYLQMLINQGVAYAIIRGAIVCLLMGYLLNPELRSGTSKRVLSTLGWTLMIGSLMTLVSPTLFGHLQSYYPIGDALIFLELGIWSKVMSAELPVPSRQTQPVRIPNFALSLLLWLNLTRERLAAKPRQLLYSAAGINTFNSQARLH